MPRVPQPSPAAPEPLRLDPDLQVRTVGCGIVMALEDEYRDFGVPHDVHRQLEAYRQRAHSALDANLNGLARRVDAGYWFPADRPLRVVPWGQQ
jgi:hypothetical protein